MIKIRRTIRPVLAYLAVFAVMFLVGFLVPKLTETDTSALDQKTLLEFSQNNILFYNPDNSLKNNSCVSTVHFAGNELTWDDLNPLTLNDRLRLLTETYGEYAMDLQRYYGVPWEIPFAIMIFESGINTDTSGVGYMVQQEGYFNFMGLTDGYGVDHYKNANYPGYYVQSTGLTFAGYDTVSKMLLGYAIYHVRNGINPDHAYDRGMKMLEPDNYRLREAIPYFMYSYCGNPEESGYCGSGEGIIDVIRSTDKTVYTGLVDVVREKGWMNSEELAKAENLPAGGYATEKWGWGDIREQIWKAYGEAGLPSAEASRYGATTTTTESGNVLAEVGGDSVLHSPGHDWLDDAGLEGFKKLQATNSSLSGNKYLDETIMVADRTDTYLNYASDAGNGSGLPGFIVLHWTAGSYDGAGSGADYSPYWFCSGSDYYCPPHFTIDVVNKKIWQYVPLSHPSGAAHIGYEDGTFWDLYGIQIEVVGTGDDSSGSSWNIYNFTDEQYDYLAKLLVAISNETGIPLQTSVKWDENVAKIPAAQLKQYIGVIGHEHIPQSPAKIDPGKMWDFIAPALQRVNYQYASKQSTITTCGVVKLGGNCFSLNSEGDGGCTEDGFTYYLQGGPSWGNEPYLNNDGSICYDGGNNKVGTIGTSGCAPAAMAMIITALKNEMVTPDRVASVSSSVGGRACGLGSYGTAAPAIAEAFGLKAEQITDPSVSEVENWLSKGAMIILSVGDYVTQQYGAITSPGMGHFIAIRGISSDGKWYSFDSSGATVAGDEGKPRSDRKYEPSDVINAYKEHGGYNMYAIYK